MTRQVTVDNLQRATAMKSLEQALTKRERSAPPINGRPDGRLGLSLLGASCFEFTPDFLHVSAKAHCRRWLP